MSEEKNFTRIAKELEIKVNNSLSHHVSLYRERFGKFIDTDNARELCPAYANSYENRALLAALIHEPASRIAKEVWLTLLAESFDKPGLVIFIAGGPGSGKSTVIKSEKFVKNFQDAIVVYDSTFSAFSSANTKIEEALNAGKDIDIYYVHRNARDAAYSVVERAVKSGRTVPIQEITNIHWGSQTTICQLCDRYRNSENVTIHLFNNLGNPKSFDWFNDENEWQNVRYSTKIEVEKLVNLGSRDAYDYIRKNKGSFPTAIAIGIFGAEYPFG